MTDPDLAEFALPPKPCKFGRDITALDKDDQRKLAKALAAPDVVSRGAIVKWLQAKGVKTTENSVATHRVEACGCYR